MLKLPPRPTSRVRRTSSSTTRCSLKTAAGPRCTPRRPRRTPGCSAALLSLLVSFHPSLSCDGVRANGTACIEKQVGTESWSDAFHLGTKLSISLSATEQAGVPAVASVSVAETVTSEFSMDYTMTNTTTFADAKSWPGPPGMTCVPTQVWWTSNCTQTIQINSFKWYGDNDQLMWPEQMGNINNLCSIWQSPSSGQHGGPPSNSFQWLLAGNNDISANFDDDLGSHFDLITQICSGTMPAPIGLQVNDKNTGVHKSYVGCEW